MKKTDFSSVKSNINDKTEKNHLWARTSMTVHLQMEKLETSPTTRALGVTLVPCFPWAIVQRSRQWGVSAKFRFYTPNISCLLVLLCALLYTRDHTAIRIFFQPTG